MPEKTTSPFPQMPAHPRNAHVEWADEDGSPRSSGAQSAYHCAPIAFIDDLPESLAQDHARLTAVAHRVQKARFSYDKSNVLAAEVSHRQTPALLVHLARQGLLDVAADQALWELYATGEALLTTAEVLEFLHAADLTADYGWLDVFPDWPQPVDRLVTQRFARDPQPLRDAHNTLAPPTKRGLALVRARFDERAPLTEFGDLTQEFARFFASVSMAPVILWPTANPSVPLTPRALFDDQAMAPNQNFDEFLALFTTPDAFGRALLTAVLDSNQVIVGTPHRLRHAARIASAPEMAQLLEWMASRRASPEFLTRTLLNWRTDDGGTLAQIALALAAPDDLTSTMGLRSMAAALAIIKLREENNEVPPPLLEAMQCAAGAPSLRWVSSAIAALPESLANNPAAIDAAYSLAEPGAAFPAAQPLFQALALLPADIRRQKIEATLHTPDIAASALPFLCLVDDPALWQRGVDLCLNAPMLTPAMAFGLGNLPLQALPLVADAWLRTDDPAHKRGMRIALLALMARAADQNALWEARWDHLVRFDLAAHDADYDALMPLLRKLIFHLPAQRAQAVILRGLTPYETFARAFQFAAYHPTQAVTQTALNALLAHAAALTPLEINRVTEGLKAFTDARPLVGWLLQNGGATYLHDPMERALGGRDQLDALRHQLTQQGATLAAPLDAVDQLAARARHRGAGAETIYALRRLATPPEDPTLNLIGAAAPGVGPERWPSREGEPMTHLFTLDLRTMPALKARHPATRTVSVFCLRPSYNEAWEAGTDHAAVVFSTQQHIDAAKPYMPEDIEVGERAWFEPVALQVHAEDFAPGNGLCEHIYQASARALGRPIWLQDEEHQGEFLMQFDDRFVDINVGDMGVMYVFADTAFWQCH